METKSTHIDYRRLVILAALVIFMAVVASFTIGQDIYETGEKSLLSFGIVNFLGYLVIFLFMPMELAFVIYLRNGYDPYMLNIVATSTALLSQIVNYLLGYFFSARVINNLLGRKRYENAEDKIRKYGNWTLFFSNLLPLSSPIVSLAAGMLKYRPKDAFSYTLIGLIFRYLSLTFVFA